VECVPKGAFELTRSIENLKKRKSTGGRGIPSRGRRAFERDGYAIEPLVGPTSARFSRRRGGALSLGVVFAEAANVSDHSGKTTKSKILRVKKSPANRDYERRGVITKGAVIETEAGEALVTSRPTDDGVVNAVLTKTK
jgi:small subunit ribosomal protein S8e